MDLKRKELLSELAYINGQWCDSQSNEREWITDPATGENIGTVPVMGETEALSAVAAAEQALAGWKRKTAKERSQVLRRWFELIREHADDLATILTREQGKPYAEALGEIQYAASFIDWFSEEAKRCYGDMVPSHKENARILVSREPIGVVAAITPWNFPAAMITRKCGPAFAAGCTMVLKPAPDTPFTALALARLAEEAGLPAGVLNVITGDAVAIGKVFTGDKRVRKISFTGSTQIGKLLMSQSAASVKKLSLELGGNAPFIVCEDADIEAAVEGAMVAKFRNAGQTCVCVNRFLVHEAVHDDFVRLLSERIAQLKLGNGFEPGVTLGPMINRAAVSKVESHVQDALSKGAKLVQGEQSFSGESNFVAPVLLTEMTPEMLVARDETFGPLAAVFKFSNDQQALDMANDTDSGLAAYLYTRSLQRAWNMGEGLEYGMVGINEGLISTEVAPFGGIKESGLGREGGRQGIEDYLEHKYMLMGGL